MSRNHVHPMTTGGGVGDQGHHIFQELAVSHLTNDRAEGRHRVGQSAVAPLKAFHYARVGDGTTGGTLTRAQLAAGPPTFSAGHWQQVLSTYDSAPWTAGSYVMPISETDIDTADIVESFYKDGYLNVTNGTGEGWAYTIAGHQEIDVALARNRNFHLFEPIQLAGATTSEVSLSLNPYDRVGPADTASSGETIVGVSLVTTTGNSTALVTDISTAATAATDYFVWLQTWGPCSVLIGDASDSGTPVMSGTAAGEVEDYQPTTSSSGFSEMVVGQVLEAADDAEHALVDLRIRPPTL